MCASVGVGLVLPLAFVVLLVEAMPPLVGGGLFNSSTMYEGFSWTCGDAAKLARARVIFADLLTKPPRKNGADLNTITWVGDQVFVRWSRAASGAAGYVFFKRVLAPVFPAGDFGPASIIRGVSERDLLDICVMAQPVDDAAGASGFEDDTGSAGDAALLGTPRPGGSVSTLKLLLGGEVMKRHGKDLMFDSCPELGHGSFGTVVKAKYHGRTVAVKRLRVDDRTEAAIECFALDMCQSNNFVIKLLDVVMLTTPCLIFELWGMSVSEFMKKQDGSMQVSDLRTMVTHVACGLQRLHGLGLIHTDIKPQNVLVAEGPHFKVADLGTVVQADPRDRRVIDDRELRAQGLAVQTLTFRAPEVFLGDRSYGSGIDIWSLGMMLMVCGGYDLANDVTESTMSEVGFVLAVFRFFGTPAHPALTSLPLWPREVGKFSRRTWPTAIHNKLGVSGLALLDRMMEFVPAERMVVSEV